MTTLTPADLDPRRQAMLMYFQGYRVARIAEMLGEKVATVHSWKKRDKWGEYGPLDQMQLTTAARYCQLIMKEQKEGKILKKLTCWRVSQNDRPGSANLTMAGMKQT
jgi:uncharacterized protein YjcR